MIQKNSFFIGMPIFVIALFVVLLMISSPSLLSIQEAKDVKFKGSSVEIFEVIAGNSITIPTTIENNENSRVQNIKVFPILTEDENLTFISVPEQIEIRQLEPNEEASRPIIIQTNDNLETEELVNLELQLQIDNLISDSKQAMFKVIPPGMPYIP